MKLNGNTQYVETVAFASPTNAITVACWAKSDTTNWNTAGMLVSKRNAFILNPSANQKNIGFFVSLNSSWVSITSTNLHVGFDIRQWHHYAGTYDTTTKDLKIFVDGQEAATTNLTTAYTIPSDSAGKLYVGWDDGIAGRYFKGAIDEVRLYDRALSSNEIVQLVAQSAESLDAVWSTTNIGWQAGGFVVQSNTLFQVAGRGTTMGPGNTDRFCFVHQGSSGGDCEIIARVVKVDQNTAINAKAGVMIREALTENDKQAMTVMNPGSNVVFSYRTNTLGQCVQTTVTGISTQYNWVKVSRSSDVYRGYYSSNGVNWIQIGSAGSMSVPMSQSAYIGLASCSYSNGVMCNSLIDNVTVTP
jgi:hypothetical protein